MIPKRLKIGDTIGVIAPADPIVGKNIQEIEQAKKIVEKAGFQVKFSKNLFSNTNGYSAAAKEKAEDLNQMFQDPTIDMIWCAKGGENSNSLFEEIDYEMIRKNPKIICGYSDIDAITNMISSETGLVTFHGTNFKTIATDETNYSYEQLINRLVEGKLTLGTEEEIDETICQGQAEGRLIGGNLSIIRGMVAGEYQLDFTNKILFLEELGIETSPALASNYLAYLKQNKVFEKIKGLWIGYYEHESGIILEKIIQDTLGKKYHFPMIKSNYFGHTENKTVIPIGTKAKIDTNKRRKIELMENCIE